MDPKQLLEDLKAEVRTRLGQIYKIVGLTVDEAELKMMVVWLDALVEHQCGPKVIVKA